MREFVRLCVATGLVAFGFVLVLTGGGALAGDWAGKYETKDTKGNEMAITLSADGIAAGLKHGKELNGTWTNEKGAAVISWTTGWTTKLSKDGDTYMKSAYRPGTTMTDAPTQTGSAEKIE